MDLENTQSNMSTEELTPEDAKASLGLATRLSDQFMMSQVPQEGTMAPQEPQETDTQGEEIDTELEDLEARLMGKIDEVDMSAELQEIKDELKSLNDHDDE